MVSSDVPWSLWGFPDNFIESSEDSSDGVVRRPVVSLGVPARKLLYQVSHGVFPYQLLVPLVDSEVPKSSGHGADDPVHLHPEQLHQYWKTFLLPDSRPDVDAGLPVAGRQVLDASSCRFQGLR